MGQLKPLETRISLEMSGDTRLYMLSAKQGDKATRYVVAELSNNGERYQIPPGAYAVVNVKKPDGKTVYNDCVYSDSEVIFELTNQMLAAAGTAYCDIEIRTKDETEIIKTQTFTIEIEKTMRNDSAILSSDEFTFFEKSMLKVKEITESLNNAKIDFEETEKRENISPEDTFAVILGKLEKIISEIKDVAYSGEYKDITGVPKEVKGATEETAGEAGIVPAPEAGKQNSYLRGNGEWSGLDEMAGATEETAGAAGIVPTPEAGKQNSYLRGNGEWSGLDEMTGAAAEVAGEAGIVPAPAAGMQDAFLRGDATWGQLGAGAFAESANNLATTQEGFYLDARQGKELADQISLVNSACGNLKNGTIPLAIIGSANGIDKPTSVFGEIETAYGLLVHNSNGVISGIVGGISFILGYTYINDTYGAQLRIDYSGGCSFRNKSNGNWSSWVSLK